MFLYNFSAFVVASNLSLVITCDKYVDMQNTHVLYKCLALNRQCNVKKAGSI